MIVTPYKRNPEPPDVALLTADGVPIDTHGRQLDFANWPQGTRCWASYDTARELVNVGVGEAVCWNNEEIHWRHERLDEDGWTNRPTDVHVLKLPFPDSDREALRGLQAWTNWLASYGAAPTGTTGSAAWSLLRATLEGELRTSEPFSQAPPLRGTVGGRQELGPAGIGRFDGDLEQWDLPAAYASVLGNLVYGRRWYTSSGLLPPGVSRDPDWWAAGDRPVFVRCIVDVPELPYGPLPRRPRSRRDGYLLAGLGCHYPVDGRLQGFWSWQEILEAEAVGCRVVKILEVFGHMADGRQPFLPWWAAVQSGREMKGMAGQLAKMTGNALWGRFCTDGRYGRRTIRSRGARKVLSRPLVFRGGQPPAHDLTETVSGRVRAKLYAAMTCAGEDLVSAHTDGIWLINPTNQTFPTNLVNKANCTFPTYLVDNDWRRKQEAYRLELLTPQNLRYWPRPWRRGAPFTVMAGEPATRADEAFDAQWLRAFPVAA